MPGGGKADLQKAWKEWVVAAATAAGGGLPPGNLPGGGGPWAVRPTRQRAATPPTTQDGSSDGGVSGTGRAMAGPSVGSEVPAGGGNGGRPSEDSRSDSTAGRPTILDLRQRVLDHSHPRALSAITGAVSRHLDVHGFVVVDGVRGRSLLEGGQEDGSADLSREEGGKERGMLTYNPPCQKVCR